MSELLVITDPDYDACQASVEPSLLAVAEACIQYDGAAADVEHDVGDGDDETVVESPSPPRKRGRPPAAAAAVSIGM